MAFRMNLKPFKEEKKIQKEESSCVYCKRPRSDEIDLEPLPYIDSPKHLYICSICRKQIPGYHGVRKIRQMVFDDELIESFRPFIHPVDEWSVID